jgi:hypothetical protein
MAGWRSDRDLGNNGGGARAVTYRSGERAEHVEEGCSVLFL